MDLIDSLISTIYEAGALPDKWASALQAIATRIGARGSNLIAATDPGLYVISTPGIAEVSRKFDEGGWNQDNTRISRLLERTNHAGFLTDLDLHSVEEIKTLPMYREFLTPHGADAGAATVISGAVNDGIVVTFEGFADHDAAFAAVPTLDRLRPHLARAAVLSNRVQAVHALNLLDAFSATSAPIALLDSRGRLQSATESFMQKARSILVDSPQRLRAVDPTCDTRLAEALKELAELGAGRSIALRDSKQAGVGVLQLIPVRRDARELFSKVAAYAVISRPENSSLPSVDIISALFDLTPAEARVARHIAEGKSIAALSAKLGVSRETVRSHLKKTFLKTSTRKQSELAALLLKLS